MTAFYNEVDPYAAAWLRNLIAAGHIAPGVVDERDIRDIAPDELAGYAQCHFFAGIGVWSYALRLAGWPDDRPVWTGSCPCQPFSAAGRGGGFADERHLWPHFHHLIRVRRPPVVLGEQVASKDGLAWLDLVQADLEGEDYAVGPVDTCAAGFGAPHIRQRLYWVAQSLRDGAESGAPETVISRKKKKLSASTGVHRGPGSAARLGGASRDVANDTIQGRDAQPQLPNREDRRPASESRRLRDAVDVADDPADGRREERPNAGGDANGNQTQGVAAGPVPGGDADDAREVGVAQGDANLAGPQGRVVGGDGPHQRLTWPPGVVGPTRGFWGGADWIWCSDGKYRPVEPGSFPLAHGAPARVGRLRAYGNAIVAEQAAEFIHAVRDAEIVL